MGSSSEKGEIVTIITIATLIILGFSSLISPLFLKNKQSTRVKAQNQTFNESLVSSTITIESCTSCNEKGKCIYHLKLDPRSGQAPPGTPQCTDDGCINDDQCPQAGKAPTCAKNTQRCDILTVCCSGLICDGEEGNKMCTPIPIAPPSCPSRYTDQGICNSECSEPCVGVPFEGGYIPDCWRCDGYPKTQTTTPIITACSGLCTNNIDRCRSLGGEKSQDKGTNNYCAQTGGSASFGANFCCNIEQKQNISTCNGFCTNDVGECNKRGRRKSQNIGSNNYCAQTGGSASYGSNFCCEATQRESVSECPGECVPNPSMCANGAQMSQNYAENNYCNNATDGTRPTCCTKSAVTQKIPLSQEEVYNKILQNDCRCVDGKWQGGLCNSWQRGETCGPKQGCLPNGSQCSEYGADGNSIVFNENACCSGFCQRGPGYGVCASKSEIVEGYREALTPTPVGSNVLTNRCMTGQMRCLGNILQECKMFSWTTVQKCEGGCNEDNGGTKCLEQQVVPTPSDSNRIAALTWLEFVRWAKTNWKLVNNTLLGIPDFLTQGAVSNDFQKAEDTLTNTAYSNFEQQRAAIQRVNAAADTVVDIGSILIPIGGITSVGKTVIGKIASSLPGVKKATTAISSAKTTGATLARTPVVKVGQEAVTVVDSTAKKLGNDAAKIVKGEPIPKPIQSVKQSFSLLDKFFGRPQSIENQAINQLRGVTGVSDDVIKSQLRKLGYAEDEIEVAVGRVKQKIQSSPQVAHNQSIPQNNQSQFADGTTMPQDKALPSHGGVVQDYVYTDPNRKVFSVADGVTRAGPNSAHTAKEVSVALADDMNQAVTAYGSDYQSVFNKLNQRASSLDTQLAGKFNASSTVGVGQITKDGKLISFRIGDVEARIVRNGKISHLDDLRTVGGERLFQGEFINPEQSYGSVNQAIRRNVPNQLGINSVSEGRLTVHSLKPGDRVVYSSDGIAKALSESEINHIVNSAKTPREAEMNLIQAALNKYGGKAVDDYSAVVIFN